MPILDGLRVISSPIHGYGVAASRVFKRGEIICYGDGVVQRPDPGFNDGYSLLLSAEDAPDGLPLLFDLVCQTRWINHSCAPNTHVMLEWSAGARSMSAWWVAARDIEIGDELTYDYAFTADFAEPCNCGAAACKGVIVDDEPENLRRLAAPLQALLRGGASDAAALRS